MRSTTTTTDPGMRPVSAADRARRMYNRDTPPISADQAEAEPDAERLYEMPTEELPADLPDVRFTRGAARRPQPQLADPLLQWATGLQTTAKTIYAGWFTEAGKHPDLDAAMERAGQVRVTIKHGAGNTVTHWALPEASLFVVCDGVQSISEMSGTTERYGIAFGWRLDTRRSVLRCRVFVQELLEVGYDQPLLLCLKSTLTGDFLDCLTRHYAALDSINPIREAAGKPPIAVPYYAVSIALGPGQEVTRGSGGQSKAITPMVEIGERGPAYIRQHWCKRPWVQQIEAMADETIRWSVRESERIAQGETGAEEWES